MYSTVVPLPFSRKTLLFASLAFLPQCLSGISIQAGQKPGPASASKTTTSVRTDPAEEHYRAAETFQLAGDFEKAELEYRRAISLSLQRLAALRELGEDEKGAIELLRSAITADGTDLDAQLNLAATYFQAGDLESAKTALTQGLAKGEDRPVAKSLLGKILFLQGAYSGAIEQLRGALAQDPELDTAYSLALSYLKLKKVQEATNVFDEMLTSLGSSAELHVLIGRAYQDGEQFGLAAGEFRKALSLNPKTSRAHSYLGGVLLQQGGDKAFDEAQKEFLAEIAIDPNDYSSHLNLGLIHLKKDEFADAEQEFTQAVKAQPESPEAHLQLGKALSAEGKLVEATKTLRKSIQLSTSASNAAAAHETLAAVLKKSGNHEEARQEAEMARQAKTSTDESPASRSMSASEELGNSVMKHESALAKSSPKVSPAYIAGLKELLGNSYHNVGVIFARRSQFAEASDFFGDAAKWSPGIKGLDRNWGLASFRAQRFKEAIVPLARQVSREPQDMTTRQMLAMSYFLTEDFKGAAETFRPVLSSLPDNAGILYAAGVSFAKVGDKNTANEIFQRMVVSHPDAAEVHLFLAQAYADQGEDAKALDEFSRAIAQNPKLPEANYGAGMIYLRRGDLEEAERNFRAELAVSPGVPSTAFRLGIVLSLQRKSGEAIPLLTDVVQKRPDDADANYELGKALLENGEFKSAIARLEKAARLKPDEPYAYYQLSLAYRRDNRASEADATLQQYEKLKKQKSKKPSSEQNAAND